MITWVRTATVALMGFNAGFAYAHHDHWWIGWVLCNALTVYALGRKPKREPEG